MSARTFVLLTLTSFAIMSAPTYAASAAAGKQKSQVCASCHGPDGNSTSGQFPRLAGQQEDYLAKALHDYKSGERKNPIMSGFAAPLSDADIADLAAYFSSQSGLQVWPPAPKK